MDSPEGQAPALLELRSFLEPNRLALDRIGVTLEEMKSTGHFGRTCHPGDLERMLDERRKGLLKGVPWELEWRFLPTHVEDRWIIR